MGGGSGDAAATLRLVFARAGLVDEALELELATGLGADVPGQLRPGRVLATGAGERVRRLEDPEPFGVLVLPSRAQLSTAAVYAQADRMGLSRAPPTGRALGEAAAAWAAARSAGPECWSTTSSRGPHLGRRWTRSSTSPAGSAPTRMVSGSGPTVLGLFADPDAAGAAAGELAGALTSGRGDRAAAHRVKPETRPLLAIAVLGLLVFVACLLLVDGGGSAPGDRGGLRLAGDLHSGAAVSVARALTWLGSAPVAWSLVLTAAAWLATHERRREAGILLAGLALTVLLVHFVKAWVDRPRPPHALTATHYVSFPSGHTA